MTAAWESEVWRVVAHNERYEVSNLGRVRSLRGIKKLYVRPQDGRPVVTLSGGPKQRTVRVCTLVCEAFHGPRPVGMEVLHGDGNSANNVATNLRWGTRRENVLDAVRHGTHPQASKTHCVHGHEFTEANTYIRSDGRARDCRTCMADRVARHAERSAG